MSGYRLKIGVSEATGSVLLQISGRIGRPPILRENGCVILV